MSLFELLQSKTRYRVKAESEPTKRELARLQFDKSDGDRRSKPVIPFDKGLHIPEPPIIKTTVELKSVDLIPWLRIILSRNPRYQFLHIRKSSWSGAKIHYVLLDVKRSQAENKRVMVMMTREEIMNELKPISEIKICQDIE